LDLAALRRIRRSFQKRIPILIQPESNRRWSQKQAIRLLTEATAAGLENIRVSVQLHKVFGLR
jgi:organic radical activating enzyme